MSQVVGSVQTWLAFPEQSQICSWVPGLVAQFVSSRHLPDCGLYSAPSDWCCQICAPVPLHVYRSTFVPSVVPPLTTSRHPSMACTVPFGSTVHCCAVEPLQVYSSTAVPAVASPPATSRHMLL